MPGLTRRPIYATLHPDIRMNTPVEALFDRMSALADPVRSRVLLVLERRELTVGELGAVFQLPQSTMSRHLKALTDEGWLTVRAEGTSRRYSLAGEQVPEQKRTDESPGLVNAQSGDASGHRGIDGGLGKVVARLDEVGLRLLHLGRIEVRLDAHEQRAFLEAHPGLYYEADGVVRLTVAEGRVTYRA